MMSRNNKGFSLLELLIVVAIILIIATIAIPSLLRSRQAANESAAVANLRTINTSQITYLSTSGGIYGDIPMLVSDGVLEPSVVKSAAYQLNSMRGSVPALPCTIRSNSGTPGRWNNEA